MPNSRGIRGEQWDLCGVCGFQFPMGQLVMQKGVLKCTRRTCFDDLTIERHSSEVERVLSAGVEQEGVDLREVDRGFFHGNDEEVY